ncbi:MAG: amino acid ABC transporter substrate-binding protein, partial [Hungatella sp.]
MKKTTKKLVSLGLAAAMAASLTACGGKSDNGAKTAGAAETTAAADAGAADQTAG